MKDLLDVITGNCDWLVFLLLGLLFLAAVQHVRACLASPCLSCPCYMKQKEEEEKRTKRVTQQKNSLGRKRASSLGSKGTWSICRDSKKSTPCSTSNISFESNISLGSWTESSAKGSCKILHSESNTSLESVISLCSWAGSSERDSPKNSRSISNTSLKPAISLGSCALSSARDSPMNRPTASNISLESTISVCTWVESPAEDASRASWSSGTPASPIIEEDTQGWQPCQGMGEFQEPYPHINFTLRQKALQRRLEGSPLQSDSTRSQTPTTGYWHPAHRGKGSLVHSQGHGSKIYFLGCNEQDFLEMHIDKKHQRKDGRPTSKKAMSRATDTHRKSLDWLPYQDSAGFQRLHQKPHSHSPKEFVEEQVILDRHILMKHQGTDVMASQQAPGPKVKSKSPITHVSHRGEVELQQTYQKPHSYSNSGFYQCQKQLQIQRDGSMLPSTTRSIPSTPSLHLDLKGKGSPAHFQREKSAISFLTYKEQELLELNVQRKHLDKNASSSHRPFSPKDKKKAAISPRHTLGWQTCQGDVELLPLHPKPPIEFVEERVMVEQKVHRKHQQKDVPPSHRPPSREAKSWATVIHKDALGGPPCHDRVGLQQFHQKPPSHSPRGSMEEQVTLKRHIHMKYEEKDVTPLQRTSSPKAPTKTTIALGDSQGQKHDQVQMHLQNLHQKPASFQQKGQSEEHLLLNWNVLKKHQEADVTPLRPASSPKAKAQASITPAVSQGWQHDQVEMHLQNLLQKQPQMGQNEEQLLLNWNVLKKHEEANVTPLRPASSPKPKAQVTIAPKVSQDWQHDQLEMHLQNLHQKQSSYTQMGQNAEQLLLNWNVLKKHEEADVTPLRPASRTKAKSPAAIIEGCQQLTQIASMELQQHQEKPPSHPLIEEVLLELNIQGKSQETDVMPMKTASSPKNKTYAGTSKDSPPCQDRKSLQQKPHSYPPGKEFSKEQMVLEWAAQMINQQKDLASSQWASGTEAKIQAGVTRGQGSTEGLQPYQFGYGQQEIRQKTHSCSQIELDLCQKALNIKSKEATLLSDPRPRRIPAALPLDSGMQGSSTHSKEHKSNISLLSYKEQELVDWGLQKKHQQKDALPSHRAQSSAARTLTPPSDSKFRPSSKPPSLHPTGKGKGSPVHVQARETKGQAIMANVLTGDMPQWLSRQLSTATSPKDKPIDHVLSHTILKSLDKDKVMQDLHMYLAKDKGQSQPYIEYPVCLQCGHCTPFCPHPRSRHSPSLLVYPRLSVRKGEVHMSLGFLLKIKRREAEQWGLGPGAESSKMRLGRGHPSKREKRRESSESSEAERSHLRMREESRRDLETKPQHHNAEKRPFPARQHSAEGSHLRSRDRRSPSGSQKVSFSVTDSPSPKPSKSHTKPSKKQSHPPSKLSDPTGAGEAQRKSPKKLCNILRQLLSCLKKTWAKLGERKERTAPTKQVPVAPPRKRSSSSQRERAPSPNGRVLPRRGSIDQTDSFSSKKAHSRDPGRASPKLPEPRVASPAKKRDNPHPAKSASSRFSNKHSRKPSPTLKKKTSFKHRSHRDKIS